MDEQPIRCDLRDGVPKIHLPKVEAPQPRRIPIGGFDTVGAQVPEGPQLTAGTGDRAAAPGSRNGKLAEPVLSGS